MRRLGPIGRLVVGLVCGAAVGFLVGPLVGAAAGYQVADTGVQTNELRKIVIGQTLPAYVFGAVILAIVINLIAGLS